MKVCILVSVAIYVENSAPVVQGERESCWFLAFAQIEIAVESAGGIQFTSRIRVIAASVSFCAAQAVSVINTAAVHRQHARVPQWE